MQKLALTLRDAKHDFDAVEVAVLPPFTDLRRVQTLDRRRQAALGTAPRTCRRTTPAPTPATISGALLAKLGCTYVVVGHSERREYHHEDRRASSTPRSRRRTGTG